MRLFKNRAIDFYLCFVLVVIMALGGSAIAFADSGPGRVTLSAGRLSLAGPTSVNAPPVTLNGRDMFSTYTLPLKVIDARGSGAGWNLSITSTTFSFGSHKLANNASKITGLVATCNPGSTCTPPRNSVRYPVNIPAGTTPPPAVQFFNAAAKSGLGSFTITPTVSIFVPRNTQVGTYTSNVYVAFGSGQSIRIVVTLVIQRRGFRPPQDFFTVNYMLPVSLNNPGMTNGHLAITSTPFATESGPMYTLPATASSIMDVAGVCQTGQNCPDNIMEYPIVLPAGNPAPVPVTFYDSTANAGARTFDITAAINIAVPVDAYAGTYSSTITIANQSGP